MKADVLALAAGRKPAKGPSKETLNHPGIIERATGIDPAVATPQAYRAAYAKLGVDIVNRVPDRPAPRPTKPGETRDLGDGYVAGHLGVYDTVTRQEFPFESVEEFFDGDPAPDGPADPSAGPASLDGRPRISLDYHALRTPVPHPLDLADIRRREELIGEMGVYYCQLYTTLFMWGVEYLGWEVFLLVGGLDPERLDREFLRRAFEESRSLIGILAQADCPFVFLHDDLADKRGPVFPPDWYDRYIFPRYPALFEPAKAAGKKVIFVADGNMEPFLERLRSAGADGVMLENPATPFESILETFGDAIVIGGIDTGILQHGEAARIREHVLEVHDRTAALSGFAMSTPGGLHGSLPLSNLEAYFDARVETGHTPPNWRA